jgi:quercetin dioxygenase-like cupin family protein
MSLPAVSRLFMKKILLYLVLLGGSATFLGAAPEASEGYKPVIQVTPLLRASTTAADQPIVYPQTSDPEVTAVRVKIPPGAETGWHKHPFPCYGYILSGELTVEIEGGKVNNLTAGQALIESVNVLHNGRNTGKEPVELVMFVTGEKAKPFTVPGPAPR